jgi:hypothetical protein
MPEEPIQLQPIPNPKPPSGAPWYESNVLWGGNGIVLVVVAAMMHNLCWLLCFAWACFVYTVWNGTRTLSRRRWLWFSVGVVLVSIALLGLKVWICPKSTPVLPAPQSQREPKNGEAPPTGTVTVQGNCNVGNVGDRNKISADCSDSSNQKKGK